MEPAGGSIFLPYLEIQFTKIINEKIIKRTRLGSYCANSFKLPDILTRS